MSGVLQEFAQRLAAGDGWALGLAIVLKATVLFAATALLLTLMRNASASARHFAIGLGFAASLALPLLTLMLPGLPVVDVPASPEVAAEPSPPAIQADAAGRDPAGPAAGQGARPAPAIPVAKPAPPPLASTVTAQLSRQPWWASAWVGIAGVLLLLLLVRAAIMNRTVRRATPIDNAGWAMTLERLRSRLGLERPVELRRGGPDQMPLVWGSRRPVVLLPEGCEAWPARRRRAVLAHELAHVARRDLTVLMLGKAACAVHWFNPLAWWLGRRLSDERERACDDAALGQGLRATHYAEELLQVALHYGRKRQLAPPMAARSELEGRIVAILDDRRNRHTTTSRSRAALAALLVFALVPLAAATVGTSRAERVVQVVKWQSDTREFQDHLDGLGLQANDVERLLRGLESPSALTRAACAWKLGEAGDARAVDPLIAATSDRDARVRQWAVRSLREFGDRRALPSLIQRLEDDDAEVREWAARGLGDQPDDASIEPLMLKLRDASPQVREWAARSLGDLGDDRAVEPLVELLRSDDDDDVREWAARSLGSLNDTRAVEPLIDALGDPEANVREWAARSLGSLRDPRATPALVEALDDPSGQVREWAGRSLGSLGEPHPREASWRRGKVEPLMPGLGNRAKRKPGDPAAIAGLIRQLDSDSASEREWAVRSLGRLDDGRAVPQLIDRLRDPAQQVREWASRALGQIGDPRAVTPLIESLQDPDDQVREWSARSLGLLQDPRMVDPLIERLYDRDSQVREWATRALGAYGDRRAIEPIAGLLDDESDQVRRWAKRALANLEPTR